MRFYGGQNLAKAERDLLLATLNQCTNNRTQTAKVLGISRSTLDKKLKQYAALACQYRQHKGPLSKTSTC
jgi:DNA-binding NtrC family response regulator